MKRLWYFFRNKRVKTTEQCLKMGLEFSFNVFGDRINSYNCRSIWIDKYGNIYKCDELYQYVF